MSINTLECVICFCEYDAQKRRPCIGTCGHSICESCKYQMTTSKCPHCNRDEAFAVTTINYQVLEVMKTLQGLNISKEGVTQFPKRFADDGKKLEGGLCSSCKTPVKKLRICLDCDSKTECPTIIKLEDGSYSLNPAGSTGDDPTARVRSVAICGDCALDEHNTHMTVPLSKLKNNSDDVEKQRIKDQLDRIPESFKDSITSLESEFDSALMDLSKYFANGDLVQSSEDKKIHCNNMHLLIDQMKDTITNIGDCVKRIQKIKEDTKEQCDYVERNKSAFSKKIIMFANADPILVADRKQNVKDALLIGIFDPKSFTWSSFGRMPNPKSNYAVATLYNKAFIVGGMYNGNWLDSLELYDKEKNLRKDGPKMKKGRTRTSAGFHNGKMFVCGGYDGTYMNSVEIFDVEMNEWRDGPTLVRQRADCAVVSCNGELYVLGGYNGKEYEEKIEKFNEQTLQFEVVGNMNGSRAGFGACVFKGRIYIGGGWSNSNNTLKTVRSYDPLSDTWRNEPSMTRDRKYFTMHGSNESVFAIRGCADNWSLIQEVERLNTEKNVWEIVVATGSAVLGTQSGAST